MTALKRDPLAAGPGSILLRSGHDGGGGGSGESIGGLQPALAAQALEMPAARTPCRHSGGSHLAAAAAPTATATASSPRAIGGPARLAHSRRGSGACLGLLSRCAGSHSRAPPPGQTGQGRSKRRAVLCLNSSRCGGAAARASRCSKPPVARPFPP